MKPIPNQKRVKINKQKVSKETGREKPYMIAYVDTLQKAASDLKGNAFKVYIYLLTNLEGYYFGLSTQDISNTYGMSIDSARDAIKQLIDKGYMVQMEGSKNEYTFYDRVDRKPVELPEELADIFVKRAFYPGYSKEPEIYAYSEILDKCKGDEEKAKIVWAQGVEI